MTIGNRWKNKFEQYNPVAKYRRKKMQSKLRNRNISFLTPNCLGGILYHDLGLEFMSPTINLMMTQKDFVKFILNMDKYLAKILIFFKHEKYACPCAKLDDIMICFTHYETEEEAEKKWKKRIKRINRNDIFIFCEERDGITEEEIRKLSALKVKGIVVFTVNKYDDIPYALYIPRYHKCGEVGNILARNYLTDKREYEKYFDFVKWFNESDGFYDISEYKRC